MKYGDTVYVVWSIERECVAGTDEDMKLVYASRSAAEYAASLNPGAYEIHECVITRKDHE